MKELLSTRPVSELMPTMNLWQTSQYPLAINSKIELARVMQ